MTERLTISVTEAAHALGCSKNTAYDLVRSRQLPHVRIGHRIRIPTAQLHEWIDRQAARSTR